MGCYVYPLNEVSAGAKAERVDLAFHGILRLHSLFSAEPLRRREALNNWAQMLRLRTVYYKKKTKPLL